MGANERLAGSVSGACSRANCECRRASTLPEQMMMMLHQQSWRHGLQLLRETKSSDIAEILASYVATTRMNEKPCSEYFGSYIKLP